MGGWPEGQWEDVDARGVPDVDPDDYARALEDLGDASLAQSPDHPLGDADAAGDFR